MANKKNLIWIVTVSIVLIAVLITLCVALTSAWFVVNRKAEGSLEFVDGIKIEYSNLYAEEESQTTKNLKLAYIDEEELKPLTLSNVTSNQVFYLANPSLKAKEGTASYYLRVRLNTNLYYKDSLGNELLINDLSRANFLQTTEGYIKNGENVTITNEKDLFTNLPELDVSKFAYFDGWYYLVSAQGAITNFEDINLQECFYNGAETIDVSLLNTNLNGEVKLALDDDIDYGEKMPFSKVVITLDIQAVETSAVSVWNS